MTGRNDGTSRMFGPGVSQMHVDVVQGDQRHAKGKFATSTLCDQLVAEVQACGVTHSVKKCVDKRSKS